MTENNTPKKYLPILMIPIRRCGSHALRLRLSFSPDFYCPYPLHIADFMPLIKLYGDLGNDDVYFQLVVDLVGLQNATMVKWEKVALDPVLIFEAVKDKPSRSIHMIIWEMLSQAGAGRHAKVVMDKSLDSIHYANELMALDDDLLFLNVVRNPNAQISSMNLSIIYEFDTLANTIVWVKAYDAAKALMDKHPDRTLTVRYEDFLNDEESVLRKICDFFGITFLESMLDVEKSKEARHISSLSHLWESNTSAPIMGHIDKFKKHLTENEIQIIETLAGDHMDRYGYPRITTGPVHISTEMIDASRQQSQLKKKEAWAALKKNNYKDYLLRKFRNDYIDMIKRRLLKETA